MIGELDRRDTMNQNYRVYAMTRRGVILDEYFMSESTARTYAAGCQSPDHFLFCHLLRRDGTFFMVMEE